jgi:hypothetical protein
MESIISLLENIGHAMPDRERVQGKSSPLVRIVPTEVPIIPCRNDTFIITGTDLKRNNLKGKKVVLIFGRESHYLTTSFFIPKLSMIYLNLTESRNDIEFIFISLDEKKDQYNRCTASHRKFTVLQYCLYRNVDSIFPFTLTFPFPSSYSNRFKNLHYIFFCSMVLSSLERRLRY